MIHKHYWIKLPYTRIDAGMGVMTIPSSKLLRCEIKQKSNLRYGGLTYRKGISKVTCPECRELFNHISIPTILEGENIADYKSSTDIIIELWMKEKNIEPEFEDLL